MARIPIRDIPNAPGVVAQPTGGNLPRVNLGAAQSLLQQSTISPDAFQGQAKGAAALAAGVGSIAGAADKFQKAALHLQEQVDDNEVWKAMDQLDQAYLSVTEDVANNPTRPQEYGPKMQKGLEEAYQRISSSSEMSEQARARFERGFQERRTKAVGEMNLRGANVLFDQNKNFAMTEVNRAIDSGDLPRAMAAIEAGRGKLFFDQEADGLMQHAHQKSEILKVQQLMAHDPDAAQDMLQDSKQTGNVPEAIRLKLDRDAGTERRRIEADNWEATANGIAEGSITSPEMVVEIFGDKFAQRNAKQIKAAFAAEPDMEQAKEDYLRISERIDALDPLDRDFKGKLFDLRRDIHAGLPEGFRKDSLDALNNKAGGRPDAVLRSLLSDNLKLARDGQMLGKWDEKMVKEGKEKDIRAKRSAITKELRVRKDAEAWIRKNPNAEPEDFQKWFNRRMTIGVRQAEPVQYGGGVKEAPKFGASDRGQRIEETFKRYEGEPERLPSSHRVTSYGGKWDPLIDSNSLKGIGAWSNRLEDGVSFAASRDVEKMLEERGVKPKESVEVTYANGETEVLRWDDRTAKTYKGKPLTGRWDIYSPGGPHPKNGLAVVSFRKVGESPRLAANESK